MPLEVIHGKLPVIAYRFNDFAYATDLNYISDESIDGLAGFGRSGFRLRANQTAFDASRLKRSTRIYRTNQTETRFFDASESRYYV